MLQALRNSPVGVFSQDLDFRSSWAGSSAFGRSPSELVGKSDQDLFSTRDGARLRKLELDVITTGVPKRERLALVHGGEARSYDLYVEPRKGNAGDTVGTWCVAADVTER